MLNNAPHRNRLLALAVTGALAQAQAGADTRSFRCGNGYGQFMTTLRFESGRLVSISYGDRVQ